MFIYTLLFLVLVVSIAVIMFARQLTDYYDELRMQNVMDVFTPLRSSFEDGSIEEIISAAADFHSKNQSYDFSIHTAEGGILYRAAGISAGTGSPPFEFEKGKIFPGPDAQPTSSGMFFYKDASVISNVASSGAITVKNRDGATGNMNMNMMVSRRDGLVLTATVVGGDDSARRALYQKILVAAVLMLAVSALGALLFARGITGPIKRLALDTEKMAALEVVPPASNRYDEVGQLERAVHYMYGALKENIAKLESEIKKVRDMESSQRYFFSMASHELKTPIAATSVLLEGMLAEVGDFKNRKKYLRECMHLMQSQNKIVSELLEVVKLSDDSIKPDYKTFELSELILTILPEYTALAQQKDQQIIVNVNSGIHCHSDSIMLGRALSNIIMNAIQNSPEGQDIMIWTDEDWLCILNTGVRIQEDVLKRILEPFFRLDLARSRTSAKSGLGLTIVSKIFEQLGIIYKLENVTRGVMFTFTVPK